VRDLANAQHLAGHEVGIICDSLTGGTYEETLFDALRPALKLGLHRIPIPRSIAPGDFVTLGKSVKLLKGMVPHVVHSHSAKGGVHGRLASWLVQKRTGNKIASFYCPHGGALHYDPASWKGKLFFAAERILEPLTDSLVFVSGYERDAYATKVGQPRCFSSLVYNGLNDAEFAPVPAGPNAADFLYIGMMRDLKGADVFLEAMAVLRTQTGKDYRALFVGDGPDKPEYLERIRALDLEKAVDVRDAMPAREAFALADSVVVPSRAESMPYLVLEALAARKPMVATHVGGIPEIFKDMDKTLICAGDATALANAMGDLINNPGRAGEAVAMGEQLRSRFSVEVMAANMETLYSQYIRSLR